MQSVSKHTIPKYPTAYSSRTLPKFVDFVQSSRVKVTPGHNTVKEKEPSGYKVRIAHKRTLVTPSRHEGMENHFPTQLKRRRSSHVPSTPPYKTPPYPNPNHTPRPNRKTPSRAAAVIPQNVFGIRSKLMLKQKSFSNQTLIGHGTGQ
jgi:hypothetical protein